MIQRTGLPLSPGTVVATPAALDAIAEDCQAGGDSAPATLLIRHSMGDWGNVSSLDAAANDLAALSGDRILSAYTLTKAGGKV